MRILAICLLLLAEGVLLSQIDYHTLEVTYGDYEVGYNHFELSDSSRSYSKIIDFGRKRYRPVSISMWEPASANKMSAKVTIKDYLNIYKTEEEWPDLPFEYFYDWFTITPTDHNVSQANYSTYAVHNYEPRITNKPVILYNSSYRASSTENFILCEYLASHGYKVIGLPSKGYEDISFEGGTIKDALSQSLDLEFLINNLQKIASPPSDQIYLMGFSFGGLSHIINACNDKRIKGVISLDGTIKYKPNLLESSALYDITNFKIPFVHISQKDIPDSLLIVENVDPSINTDFVFYDEIDVRIKYQIKSINLSHSFFSSYGLLFTERSPQQDVEYVQIKKSYENLLQLVGLCLSSLSAHNLMSENGIDSLSILFDDFEMVDSDKKLSFSSRFVSNIGLEDMFSAENVDLMYKVFKRANPEMELSEADLNVLGLQLIFQEDTFEAGVNIFKFALKYFSNSSNLHDSLAEGYRYNNKLDLAKYHFLKSLELYPGNENAKKRLIEIGN